jgi:tRNA(Arg) A34 adenosine deaminase TadA
VYPVRIELLLPGWMDGLGPPQPQVYPTIEERMELVLRLARENVTRETGGPFAAAVFETESGKLIAVGVNRVEPMNCSIAHAEIMAIMLAQERLKSYDLGNDSRHPHELVSSAQPCAMCFGAILWSGITRLVFSARARDVKGILGFDEGPMPSSWKKELTTRGIEVLPPILQREGREVLRLYREKGGTIYNSRRGASRKS